MREANYKSNIAMKIFFEWHEDVLQLHPDWRGSMELYSEYSHTKKEYGLKSLIKCREEAREENARYSKSDGIKLISKLFLWDNLLNKQVAFVTVD